MTNLSRTSARFIAFFKQRGTVEQYIMVAERHQLDLAYLAIFGNNGARLQLHVVA
jgi:hypothetical protein